MAQELSPQPSSPFGLPDQTQIIKLHVLSALPAVGWPRQSLGTEIKTFISKLIAQLFLNSQIEAPIDLRDDRIMAWE